MGSPVENNAHPDLGVLAGGLAIVIGGASGIGYALAKRSIVQGMHGIVVDIDSDAVNEAEDSLTESAITAGVDVVGYTVDVSSEVEVVKFRDSLTERFGGSSPTNEVTERMVANFKAHGMPPDQCADYVFEALRTGTFYILAEADEDPGHIHNQAKVRMDAILNDGRPFRPHSQFIAKVFSGRS